MSLDVEHPPKKHKTCGLIMPISKMGDYSEEHWLDVKQILSEVSEELGLRPRLVSEADHSHVIQSTIIQNVHDDEIVIVDVSGMNPNVLFELGLRLAFDKPAVLIKDERTSFKFDTSPYEHLPYNSSLRPGAVKNLKETLSKKLKGTLAKYEEDPSAISYIQKLASVTVKELKNNEVSPSELLLQKIQNIENGISALNSILEPTSKNSATSEKSKEQLVFEDPDDSWAEKAAHQAYCDTTIFSLSNEDRGQSENLEAINLAAREAAKDFEQNFYTPREFLEFVEKVAQKIHSKINSNEPPF